MPRDLTDSIRLSPVRSDGTASRRFESWAEARRRSLGEEVGGQFLELGMLDPTQPDYTGIVGGTLLMAFAQVDEGERVEWAGEGQTPRHLGLCGRSGERWQTPTQAAIHRMGIEPTEPVLGVPVVGLTTVQDGMDHRRLGVLQILDDVVRGVVVIVVEQGGRPEPQGLVRLELRLPPEAVERVLQRTESHGVGPRARPQLR